MVVFKGQSKDRSGQNPREDCSLIFRKQGYKMAKNQVIKKI